MRYLLALACLAACGADPSYRGASGAITPVPWRCKDATSDGTWRNRSNRVEACPVLVPITCPDRHGLPRQLFFVSENAFIPADRTDMRFAIDGFCDRVREAGG